MGIEHPGHAHPAARQLLDAQRVGQQRLAQTAVLLRNHQSEQTHVPHLVDDLLRIGVAAFEFRRVGNDFLLDELPYRSDDLGLEFGQAEGLGEFGHALSFLSAAQQAIVLAFVRRAMSAVVKPKHCSRTSAVSCPKAGAGALAGWMPSNAAGMPGAK